jgi:hypothetical protein
MQKERNLLCARIIRKQCSLIHRFPGVVTGFQRQDDPDEGLRRTLGGDFPQRLPAGRNLGLLVATTQGLGAVDGPWSCGRAQRVLSAIGPQRRFSAWMAGLQGDGSNSLIPADLIAFGSVLERRTAG